MASNKAADELGQELDRLYELPPGEFTAARDEAAKRLRADGRRELADEVKRLRKPTLPVWLANRLAHERELDLKRLLKAGEALGASQSAGSAEDFAEARREEQHALERLAAAARDLAAREGAGAPAVERAVQTLRAASLTAEGRDLLGRGRLTEELEPPGFDALTGLSPALPAKRKKPKPPPKADRGERRRAIEAARERVKELRAEERARAKESRASVREAERAETEAAALRRTAEEAEAAAATATEARAAAEAELRALE
jgi:DNA repair exonuclease SbcCD ATPase subunit